LHYFLNTHSLSDSAKIFNTQDELYVLTAAANAYCRPRSIEVTRSSESCSL